MGTRFSITLAPHLSCLLFICLSHPAENETIYLKEGCLANLLLLYGCAVRYSGGWELNINIDYLHDTECNKSFWGIWSHSGDVWSPAVGLGMFSQISSFECFRLAQNKAASNAQQPIRWVNWDILSSLSIHKHSLSWELCIEATGNGCFITHFKIFIYLFILLCWTQEKKIMTQ